jgi:hypothetical protein
MIKEVNSIDDLPKDIVYVLIIKNSNRAPCQKFINNCSQVAGRIKDIPFYCINFNEGLNDFVRVSLMPALYIIKDGKILNSICGHFWEHFEIEREIKKVL